MALLDKIPQVKMLENRHRCARKTCKNCKLVKLVKRVQLLKLLKLIKLLRLVNLVKLVKLVNLVRLVHFVKLVKLRLKYLTKKYELLTYLLKVCYGIRLRALFVENTKTKINLF